MKTVNFKKQATVNGTDQLNTMVRQLAYTLQMHLLMI
jgi:hypothetical protein